MEDIMKTYQCDATLVIWFLCFLCLFRVFRPTWEFFTHTEIVGEWLQILTYARNMQPLSSEGSLACHTYWDTGHLFTSILAIPEDPYTYYRAFDSGAVTTRLTT